MSKKVLEKKVRALEKRIKRNSPTVERKIAKSGLPPDPAVAFSIARYYGTLTHLAKE